MSSTILKVREHPGIGSLLRHAYQRVRTIIYEGIREKGFTDLNPAHLMLFRYEGLDGKRPTQLAEEMQITKQSINSLIRDLEERGYIELSDDPDDKRARLIRLTKRGKQLETAIWSQVLAAEEEFTKILGKSEFENLYRMLTLLKNNQAG